MQKLLKTVNFGQVGFALWSIGRGFNGVESTDLKQLCGCIDVWQWPEEVQSRERLCPLRMENKNVLVFFCCCFVNRQVVSSCFSWVPEGHSNWGSGIICGFESLSCWMFSLLVILLEYEDTCDWVCVSFHTLTVKLWLTVMILRTSGITHFSAKTEVLVPVLGDSPLLCHRVLEWGILELSCHWNVALSFWWKTKSWHPVAAENGMRRSFTAFLCFGTKTGDLERICYAWGAGLGYRFCPLWPSAFDVMNRCSQLANVVRQVRIVISEMPIFSCWIAALSCVNLSSELVSDRTTSPIAVQKAWRRLRCLR